MDNKGFRNVETGTELKRVEVNGGAAGTSKNNQQTVTCSPEVCRKARQTFRPPDLSEGPWHKKKTYFFVGTIVLLLIWIVVYATLSHYDLL